MIGSPAAAQVDFGYGNDQVKATVQDNAQAAEQANIFLKIFDGSYSVESKAGDFYDKSLGSRWSSSMGKSDFSSELERIGKSLGGAPTERTLVEATPFGTLPISGETGTFMLLAFVAKYPAATIREEVYLEQLGSGWKVIGALMRPIITSQ
jgi:hypothetical protein